MSSLLDGSDEEYRIRIILCESPTDEYSSYLLTKNKWQRIPSNKRLKICLNILSSLKFTMVILTRIRHLTAEIELTMSDRSSDLLVIELITRHNPLVKLTDLFVRLGNQVTRNQSWSWLSHWWIGSGQRNRRHNFRSTRHTPSWRSYLDYKIHLKSLKQVRIKPFKSKLTHLTKKRFQGVFCDSFGQVSDEKLVLLQPRRILKSVTFVGIALGHEHGPAFNAGAVAPERSLGCRLRRELHVSEPFGSATKVVHETHLLHFTDLTKRGSGEIGGQW